MKKTFCALVVFFHLFPLMAADGVLSGERSLRYIKTTWFDIIFPAASEPTARVLAKNADRIYQQIADDYGHPVKFRMPVVITPAVEQFNAYFAQAPYNHIVLYDTAVVDDLSVFSETLLSVFTHELTHAYTYNMKNKFWSVVGNIFGDIVNPAWLFITSGWAEGATLTQESREGEGRLNSGFALQPVRQAAIEDVFPAYADVQGARDTYPTGAYYVFNGSFNQYLQDTYGMEKYARFWYSCVNFQTLSAGMAFKNAYGISITNAWKAFKEQLQVPHVEANPIAAGVARDFFVPESSNYSMDNNAGSRYASLTTSDRNMAWIDNSTGAVFLAELEGDGRLRTRKLFTMPYVQDISLSSDGRFLVTTVLTARAATPRIQLKVYDLHHNKWTMLSERGRGNGAIVRHDGEYFFICTEYRNLGSRIIVQRLHVEEKKLRLSPHCETEFQANTFYGDFVSTGDGRIAFIEKQGNIFSICLSNMGMNETQRHSVPNLALEFRNLSLNQAGRQLLFSWAAKDTLPRLGQFSLEDGSFSLQSSDISGGVLHPVVLPGHKGAETDSICFVGNFYTQSRLLTSSAALLEMEAVDDRAAVPDDGALEEAGFQKSASDVLADPVEAVQAPLAATKAEPTFQVKNYNPFRYYIQGIFLPVSTVDWSISSTEGGGVPLLGITYVSSNPWNTGLLLLSGGLSFVHDNRLQSDIEPSSNKPNKILGGYQMTFSSGTATSLFNWNLSHYSHFSNIDGWVASTVSGGTSTHLPFGRISSVTISESASVQFKKHGMYLDIPHAFQFINSLGISYSNVHKWGPGLHEKLGISLGAEVYYVHSRNIFSQDRPSGNSGNVGLSLTVHLPRLVPVDCVQNHTYNLPTRLDMRLFSSGLSNGLEFSDVPLFTYSSWTDSRWTQGTQIAVCQAQTILYSINIQKGIPFIPFLYANEFLASLVGSVAITDYSDLRTKSWRLFYLQEYGEAWQNQELVLTGVFGMRTALGMTPNFGAAANSSLRFNLYLEALSVFDKESAGFTCNLGFSARL